MWMELVTAALEVHHQASHHRLSDFLQVVGNIHRRVRTRGTMNQASFREAADRFQKAATTQVLRVAREVEGRFSRAARERPQLPDSRRSDAGIAMFDAVRDHGLNSRQHLAARDEYSRVLHDYGTQLHNELDRTSTADAQLSEAARYYRNLANVNDNAARVYGELVDHPALVALMGNNLTRHVGDSLRTDFLLAHVAFTDLRRHCNNIRSSVDRIRRSLREYQRTLGQGIDENNSYINQDQTRAPTRREERDVARAR